LLLASVVAKSLEIDSYRPYPPPKPNGVPSEGVWARLKAALNSKGSTTIGKKSRQLSRDPAVRWLRFSLI